MLRCRACQCLRVREDNISKEKPNLIRKPNLIPPALNIHSARARHASDLNPLNGADPFPDTLDEAETMDEVLKIAGGLIVDCK